MVQLPRAIATSLLCALPDIIAVVALAIRQQTAAPLPPPWITVDTAGSARTISPALTVTEGTTSTISPPPDELTRIQTWRMSTHGVAFTTATRAPIATATTTPPSGSGGGGGGVMLKCQHYIGPDAPFCLPYRGSLLNPGTTYYCTPHHFASGLARHTPCRSSTITNNPTCALLCLKIKSHMGH